MNAGGSLSRPLLTFYFLPYFSTLLQFWVSSNGWGMELCSTLLSLCQWGVMSAAPFLKTEKGTLLRLWPFYDSMILWSLLGFRDSEAYYVSSFLCKTKNFPICRHLMSTCDVVPARNTVLHFSKDTHCIFKHNLQISYIIKLFLISLQTTSGAELY